MLADAGEGPLGGLRALYTHAGDRRVVVVACDMPFVASLGLLLAHAPAAPLVAPRREGRWEPFFSRHDPRVVAPIAEAHAAAGRLALQPLFDAVPATALDLPARELDDWDTPEDRAR
ncbi:MAG: NTP transferase domain-containing protein [Labilithrix sp.]|nr:NTP transferase domain-containing protein [Labilithrix sp.]MCW5810011.1 NTP transferase domain-containing protein [Labilithrix sp.]